MRRSEAYARIRKVIGKETCGIIYGARVALKHSGHPGVADRLHAVSATTHQLRCALMAMLVLHKNPDSVQCPNCEHILPEHGPNCVVEELLRG